MVGMVILFSRNYSDRDTLTDLCQQIHALRSPALLIAVDHEGGRVQRFRDGFTRLPPMAALGAVWDDDPLLACRIARAVGVVLAVDLRSCGVDLSFTPVLDLDWGRSGVIGNRAFHRDARVVSLLAANVNHGLAVGGLANCGKHFPGHGWAAADSHVDAPVDERSLAEILLADALPYAQLGWALDAVMPAHVVYPAVDRWPAGFSRIWLQDILRNRLGFGGVIFSDDLSMAGARVAGDTVQAARVALAAGCDFALVCNDPVEASRVAHAIEWRPSKAFKERSNRLRPRLSSQAARTFSRTHAFLQALEDLARLGQTSDR
jgi:beta-N-acetylhexosaminidase